MIKAMEDDNIENAPEFRFGINSGFDEHPYIGFSLPNECWPEHYEGCGTYSINLEDILQEALNDHLAFDGGEGTHKITALLRKYADLLDEDAKNNAA